MTSRNRDAAKENVCRHITFATARACLQRPHNVKGHDIFARSRGFSWYMFSAFTDHHLSIQAKAKHEMLANLVLPAFVEELPRTRLERRNTFTFQEPIMRTKKDGTSVFIINIFFCAS